MQLKYLILARRLVPDLKTLLCLVSQRVSMLERGRRPLVFSDRKLASEDIALLEISAGKVRPKSTRGRRAGRAGKKSRMDRGPPPPLRRRSHAMSRTAGKPSR